MLAKSKLNTTEVLISNALIDWYISHDDFFSVTNVLMNIMNIMNLKKQSKIGQKFRQCINMIHIIKELLISKKEFANNDDNKINLHCFNYSKFTNNHDIKIIHGIDEKRDFYSYSIYYGFKKACKFNVKKN